MTPVQCSKDITSLGQEEIMIDPMEVVETMCERYQTAVSANESAAYGRLFAADAIRVPPGAEPEHGPDEIAPSEQKDYDVATWSVQSRPLDALRIDDDWVYGVAEADINTVAHADGAKKSFKATKTWLLQKQPSGHWLIKRQMWNLK
jgi:ketosteroid isomerase-like protein